jgi:hypothetical protein
MPQSMNTWPETLPKVRLIGELSVWFADLGHLADRPCVRKELAFSLSRSSIGQDLVDL